jgi:hypothetical protein
MLSTDASAALDASPRGVTVESHEYHEQQNFQNGWAARAKK